MSSERKRTVNVGSASIVMIFTVLCLTVFAVLAYETAYQEYQLAEKNMQAMEQYYVADAKGEEVYRQIATRVQQGKTPADICEELKEVTLLSKGKEIKYFYRIPIDEKQMLSIILEQDIRKQIQVQTWKVEATGDWNYVEELEVWDGE